MFTIVTRLVISEEYTYFHGSDEICMWFESLSCCSIYNFGNSLTPGNKIRFETAFINEDTLHNLTFLHLINAMLLHLSDVNTIQVDKFVWNLSDLSTSTKENENFRKFSFELHVRMPPSVISCAVKYLNLLNTLICI